MRLAFGVGVTDVGFTGGVSDGADGGRLALALLGDAYNGLAVDARDNSYAMRVSTDAEIILDGEVGIAIAAHVNQYAMRA